MPDSSTLWQRTRRWLSNRIAPGGRVALRRFDGARVDRLAGEWFATATSINQELAQDLDRLRARGRQLAQNNDYAAKFRGMCADNIIGPDGIRLQMRVEGTQPGSSDEAANDAIERAWLEWGRACDVTGTVSLRDFCEALVAALPSDGEFLVRPIRGAAARNRFNFALQAIDVDRIDTMFNGRTNAGALVINGIEVDEARRPVAVHLFVAHPNDGARGGRDRVRVPVDEVLHRFKVTRPEQVRGIPWMAPGMLSLHHLGSFKLAALLAAEHGANHFGFFQTPDGAAPTLSGEVDAMGNRIETSQPGTFDTLPAGVTFQPYESKYPNEVFGPFVKTTLQRIATGWRVAYHSLANDLEGVSFSSIRSGTLEERDRWAADQAWFVAAFMEPVFRMWLEMALLSGAITLRNGSPLPLAKIEKFAAHEWQPRRWEWVDPKADMEAKILAVRAGLMAPQDLAAAMGQDFGDVMRNIAAAQKLAASLGIDLNAYAGTPGASGAPAAAGSSSSASSAPAPARAINAPRQPAARLPN